MFFGGEPANRAVCFKNMHLARSRIDNPSGLGACRQVLAHFLLQIPRGVAFRYYFDCQIRRTLDVVVEINGSGPFLASPLA